MRIFKRILLALAVLLLIFAAGFTAWAYTPLGPMPEALAALQSDAAVTVQASPWLTFSPAEGLPTTGFIFYPGGRVDPRSYAPTARAIAEQGYLVVIVPMPLNLAVAGANRADAVIAAYDEISHWAIGGHSLGGAMAATYAFNHPGKVDGVVFWAAYPAGNNSLADRDLRIASIFGARDGLATRDKIDASRSLVPASALWIPIPGGNHAQFGYYGPQGGDGSAQISREQQQAQVVDATVKLLESLSN